MDINVKESPSVIDQVASIIGSRVEPERHGFGSVAAR